jgi:hypothetical protein
MAHRLHAKLQTLYTEAQHLCALPDFDEHAHRLLSGLDFTSADQAELFEMFLQASLPAQNFRRRDFGQPSITLFSDGKVALDFYVWVQSNLAIHSHNFAGAFRLLRGRSYQHSFEFRDAREFAPHIRQGKLETLEHFELLPGRTIKISFGERFIHSVFHLESPSITLCLRTIGSKESLSSYLFPRLEITADVPLRFNVEKKLDILNLLPLTDLERLPAPCDSEELALMYWYAQEDSIAAHVRNFLKGKVEEHPWGPGLVAGVHQHQRYDQSMRALLSGQIT